jgi:hypothetical protein
MAPRAHDADNARERQRLAALVARLSDTDLARPMPAGWTVASVLAHLAFWDQRALDLLDAWERGGVAAAPRRLDEAGVDWINDASKPLFNALAPRRAAEVTLAIAEAVDRKVAGLSDALVEANRAAGHPVNLLRAEHRREHLEEIEHALGR